MDRFESVEHFANLYMNIYLPIYYIVNWILVESLYVCVGCPSNNNIISTYRIYWQCAGKVRHFHSSRSRNPIVTDTSESMENKTLAWRLPNSRNRKREVQLNIKCACAPNVKLSMDTSICSIRYHAKLIQNSSINQYRVEHSGIFFSFN